MSRERVFSGVQPTGEGMHLGNYLGAVKGMLSLQDTYDCIFAVVDYHALTVPYDPAQMPQRKLSIAMDYLAAGLDPEKVTLIVQSDVPEHLELAWVLGCLTSVPRLERMPTYQEKKRQSGSAGFGLLFYPVLMAADILIYKATKVPVGKDQEVHLRFARELARRFNGTFGETFPEPYIHMTEAPMVPSLSGPGAMAKSVPGSYIGLDDPPDEIRHKLAKAYTDPARKRRADPGDPANCNVYAIHEAYSQPPRLEEIADGCRSAGIGCLGCKAMLAEEIISDLQPFQERRRELDARPGYVLDVLA
ncbi:MAG: tryptophan--tRNA ligase, partial [Anaerolineae bacterium]|nr:tryptophan--tRNA ligase [Anaerolineae bacterium]NIN97208.1 tryptophan--tRNA ligase [Anaerolineae bacterium]NIQ80161.1 tryptophan--tRNA ligase [Anaerolineae bacterium]